MRILSHGTRYGKFETLREKLLALTDRRGPNECWPWCGAISRRYGRCSWDHKNLLVHRATYEEFVGPIPDGFSIDHTCFNRYCQNPAHLEAVTPGENSRRYQENKRLPSVGKTMLTPSQRALVVQIYLTGGVTQQKIANLYGVTQSYVAHLLRRSA